MNEIIPKTRGKYNTKKSQKLESLLEAAKEFKNTIQTKKPKYTIAELTNNVCLYPNRYLNHDDTCIKCDLYEYCGCSLKNLGKRK